MILIAIFIVVGVILGLYIPIEFFSITSFYVSVGILAAMDAIVGAIKATYMDEFDPVIFGSGLFINTILAMILSWVGDRLGIPLYYAAVFVFGTRLFNNLALIRRQIITRFRERRRLRKTLLLEQSELEQSESEEQQSQE